MTLQEILDMVALKYPHALTYAQVISMVNDVQRRIFRTIYKPITADVYDVIADNPFYPVDYSSPSQTTLDVVVNGKEYPYQDINLSSQSYYYYIEDDNTIGLYPTPTESITAGLTVFHYKDPATLTESSPGSSPDFDADWHMIIVYRVCRQIAEIAQDGDMVQNFTADINTIETEYRRSKRARQTRIQDVYGVGRRSR